MHHGPAHEEAASLNQARQVVESGNSGQKLDLKDNK